MPTLESMRPDVLGSITAWDGDWWCQAIYFPSEIDARWGEKKCESMSADDRVQFEEMMGAYGEPRFVDGPNPILVEAPTSRSGSPRGTPESCGLCGRATAPLPGAAVDRSGWRLVRRRWKRSRRCQAAAGRT